MRKIRSILLDFSLIILFHKITCIITSCILIMFFPVSKALPAKAKLTLVACHLVTAFVLFNVCLAIWTLFCILLDPFFIFKIASNFREIMCIPAITGNHRLRNPNLWIEIYFLNDFVTIFWWTPLHWGITLYKLHNMKLNVFFFVINIIIDLDIEFSCLL